MRQNNQHTVSCKFAVETRVTLSVPVPLPPEGPEEPDEPKGQIRALVEFSVPVSFPMFWSSSPGPGVSQSPLITASEEKWIGIRCVASNVQV
jgi:hypothetical protein